MVVRRRGEFANCTHVILSLLKPGRRLWYEYSEIMPSFDAISRRSTPEIVLPSKNLNSSSKVANWIIVDILKYLLCYH